MSARSPRRQFGPGLALCVLLGCSQSVQARLDGRWRGERFESLDGSVSAGRAGWAKGTSLSFSGTRIRVQLPGEPSRGGTYAVLDDRDGELELSITGHDGHVDRAELTLETDELLRWHLTRVHTLVMRRD